MKTNKVSGVARYAADGATRSPGLERAMAGHPFLKGLSPHHFRLLRECALLARFKPGEVILREGDPANRFYLILRGKVELFASGVDGADVPIETVGAGDMLGWSWLFSPHYWNFDARAVEPTDAIFFYGTPLREECETDHDLGYELLKRMSEVIIHRLQATRRQLVGQHHGHR